MKRTLCLLLSTVLLFGMLGGSISASADGIVTLVVTGGEVKPGEDVEVLVSIENNPSISGISGEIKWDESVMSYVDFTAKTNKGVWSMDTFPDDHVILWQYDGQTNAYTGTELISLKFHVAEDAAPGEYPVTIELDPDWDAIVDEDNGIIENFEIVAGTVTVTSEDTPSDVVTLTLSKETAQPGKEVEVLVSILNNPSISGISGEIKWDESVMSYVDFTAKTNKGVWSMDTFNNDHVILWQYDGQTNAYTGTELISLKFHVAEDAAPGEYPVTIELDPDWDAIVDEDNNTIEEFEIVGGSVTVVKPDTIADGYYLIGQKGWTVNDIDPEQKFEPNPNNANEYLLETGLTKGDGIKVVQVTNGEITAWYPDGMDNQYIVDQAHSGRKTIYFKTSYDSGWSEFGGYMWIDAALTVGAEVYGSSVSLKGDIALNFFLIIPDELKADEGAYVMIGTEKFPIKDAATRTVGEDTLYQFTVQKKAKEMNDQVTLQVFTGADEVFKLYNHTTGEDVTEGYVYSVQTYIEKTIATSTDAKLVALVKAMSDYGSLAQDFMEYNVDNRAEVQGDLNSVTLETVAQYKSTTTEGTATGVTCNGGTLVLQSTTAIRLYFTLNEGEIGDYTFKLGKKAVTPKETSDGWMIEIANISAKDLDKVYTVTVSSSAGTVVTVKYCGLSYVYSVLNTSSDAKLIDLAKGIYLYNQAADAYFAK